MDSWGWLLVIGMFVIPVLVVFLVRAFRRPKKKVIQTYIKPKKNKKTKYGKRRNGKSH